jgi:cytochrome P450
MNVINQVSKRSASVLPKRLEEGLSKSNFTQTTTFEYIYGVLFGLNPGVLDGTATEEEEIYINLVRRFFHLAVYKLGMDPDEITALLRDGTSPTYKEFEGVMGDIIVYGEKICRMVCEKVREGTTDEDVLNSYIAKQYLSDPENVDLKDLSINCALLLSAGVDTTSCLITMMLTRLAENPELQDAIVKEIKSIQGASGHPEVQYVEKDKYHLLKACMKEVSRLTPVTGGFVRSLDEPIVIQGSNVPANTSIVCTPAVHLRMEEAGELWDDWASFNPHRWASVTGDRRGSKNPFGKLWSTVQISTFGRGSHMCLGLRIAEVEILSFFSEVLPRYQLSATWDPESPPYRYSWERGLGNFLDVPEIKVEKRV